MCRCEMTLKEYYYDLVTKNYNAMLIISSSYQYVLLCMKADRNASLNEEDGMEADQSMGLEEKNFREGVQQNVDSKVIIDLKFMLL